MGTPSNLPDKSQQLQNEREKSNSANFLNNLREKLVAAAKTIEGVDIWAADALDAVDVTGFVLEYKGETYVVEIFAKEERDDE